MAYSPVYIEGMLYRETVGPSAVRDKHPPTLDWKQVALERKKEKKKEKKLNNISIPPSPVLYN